MNTAPLSDYIKAIETYRSGNIPAAEAALASSLGMDRLTPILKDSLAKACDIDRPNEAVVTLLIHRLQGGR